MPGMVEMICLANSRKMQGRCIAGLRTDGAGWVRPVAPNGDGTLFPAQYRLPDGTDPKLLDVIQVGYTSSRPEPHQPENLLIDTARWQRAAPPEQERLRVLLTAYIVKGPLLLGNFGNKRDYGDLTRKPAVSSLALIAPEDLLWNIQTDYRGNRQTKAKFSLTHTPYSLSITDPIWVLRLAHLPNGLYPPSAAGLDSEDQMLLTVSLSEPTAWDNCCYKLVAGVIVLPR